MRTIGISAGVYLVAVLLVIVISASTYGFFAVTDIGYYRMLAGRMALGLRPYFDFPLEYPPLAALLVRVPHPSESTYPHVFAAQMFAWGAATAVIVGVAAARLWSGPDRLLSPLVFAGGIVASGAIVANRLDTALGFVIAAALLLLVLERHVAAAAVLGIGFALKLTPIILLPLVVIVAHRRWAVVAAFCCTAAIPFLPYLGAPYLSRVWLYHAERPLQFESVLATPFLVGHALGLPGVGIGTIYGSQAVVAPGAGTVALLSAPAGVAALGVTYAVVLLRRTSLGPRNIALPALAVMLTFLSFGKVLSPQFFIWLLPAVALVAPRHRLITAVFGVTLVLTQIEFPGLFRSLVALDPLAIAVVALRNVGLVATWLLALAELGRAHDPVT